MNIEKYTERLTLIFNRDGSLKGGEARDHTGYVSERDVPDSPEDATGPEGKVNVFIVTEEDVRPVEPKDVEAILPKKGEMAAKAARRAEEAREAIEAAAKMEAERDGANERAETLEKTVSKQARLMQVMTEERGKLETDLHDTASDYRRSQREVARLRTKLETADIDPDADEPG